MSEPYHWEYENSVSTTKEYCDPDTCEHKYSAFRTNRYFSKFIDTLSAAEDMNLLPHLDARLQYDYLFAVVRKRKRFTKGSKKDDTADVELLRAHYKYSALKAREALRLLTGEQLAAIREATEQGGPIKL